MNPLIAFLLVFSALGALDKLLGGRFGLAGDFDKGLSAMGPLCLSMAGVYCAAVTVSEKLEALERVPALASLAAGCVLAPDLGGTAVCAALSSSGPEAVFTGVLVSSTLGCLVSFVLPISLGALRGEAAKEYLRGAALGVAALPAGLLAGGIVCGMSAPLLFSRLVPVAAVCAALLFVLLRFPRAGTAALGAFGALVRWASIALFAVMAVQLFLGTGVFETSAVTESLAIAARITLVVCGSNVLCGLLLRRPALLGAAAQRLGVSREAAAGLAVSFATSLSMLPLFDKMDARGKAVNAAFSVGGAFCLGGQLAFVASAAPASVGAYLVCKLAAGACGALLAAKTTPRANGEVSA